MRVKRSGLGFTHLSAQSPLICKRMCNVPDESDHKPALGVTVLSTSNSPPKLKKNKSRRANEEAVSHFAVFASFQISSLLRMNSFKIQCRLSAKLNTQNKSPKVCLFDSADIELLCQVATVLRAMSPSLPHWMRARVRAAQGAGPRVEEGISPPAF